MKNIRYSLLMALAALIWGTAFVAQRLGADKLDAYSFNSARSFIGFLVLVAVAFTVGRRGTLAQIATPGARRELVLGGALCGLVLTVSTLFQQVGLAGTTAGKAGFITALYIVIVPIFGMTLGRRVSWLLWVAIAVAVAGMYLLCIKDGFSMDKGDRLVLCCAFTFSVHILFVDHFAKKVDNIALSAAQFFFCGIFSLVPFAWNGLELPSASAVASCWAPILYTAIFSSGIAYTLQIVTQKHLSAPVASLVMSLESVFAALSGWLILGEHLQTREFLGCALVFGATILAQVPAPRRETKRWILTGMTVAAVAAIAWWRGCLPCWGAF